jgi:RIO kinase 1
MWALYESGELTFETKLTGLFQESNVSADVDTVIEEIKAAFLEEQERLQRIAEVNETDEIA